jgi:hypothetical protein
MKLATKKESPMKKLWNHPLGREILVILGIKFALIFGIWWAFFSGPSLASLSPEQVRNAVLAAPPAHSVPKE